jgi:IMP dehydrogenase family protein
MIEVAEVEIGIGKSGRRAYGFDDIAIVPSRRTRDPEDVDISWEIDAFRFELPLMGSAMDGVISPATAIEIGRLGGVGVLNLEGLWTRYEDPDSILDEISRLSPEKATLRMQDIYSEPIKPELIGERISEIKEAGVVSCASVTPQRTDAFAQAIIDAELDLLVIQGTVVSAEHVSKTVEPLNLKRFVRELDMPVIVHCEDKNLSSGGVMHEGLVSTELGLAGIPGVAEEVMVARDLLLAEFTGAAVHIAHVSTAGAVRLIREAKDRGVRVTAETAPHYFTLTDEAVRGFDTNAKVYPPLRGKEDVAAIREIGRAHV